MARGLGWEGSRARSKIQWPSAEIRPPSRGPERNTRRSQRPPPLPGAALNGPDKGRCRPGVSRNLERCLYATFRASAWLAALGFSGRRDHGVSRPAPPQANLHPTAPQAQCSDARHWRRSGEPNPPCPRASGPEGGSRFPTTRSASRRSTREVGDPLPRFPRASGMASSKGLSARRRIMKPTSAESG